MKCPLCLSDKAYRREIQTWLDALVAFGLLMPFKCHHCFHRFYAFWPSTLGKVTRPPRPSHRGRQQTGDSRAMAPAEAAERPPVAPRRRMTPREVD